MNSAMISKFEHGRSGAIQPTTIYLVRHGESELNRDKRISGQLDPPLSREGLQGSLALADQLHGVPLTAIYTSSLMRAIETAKPTAFAHGLTIYPKEALNELHLGVLQGRHRDDRDPEARSLWEERKKDKIHYRVPGGETFAELAERVIRCLDEILAAEAGGTILIVGHRATNRALFGALLNWPEEQWPILNFRHKYLYEITTGPQPQLATIRLNGSHAGVKSAALKL
jgi:broad specificity phosphatase PhoE